ncbi:hypothetical protein ACS0TY_015123 [Phlomoides rotata]
MSATARVIGTSEQVILVHARHNLFECTFGLIHAASNYVGHRDLWQYISGFHCTNLCLIGDFNAVLGAHERISSRAPNSVSCADFQGFIERELLFEVEAVGSAFTWASRRLNHGLIASKLDRVLAHESFIDHWDCVSATVLARVASDHHPLLLHCDLGSPPLPRPFKFQTPWTLDIRFSSLVHSSWTQPLRASDPVSLVVRKLRHLKAELRVWNKEVFGLISNKIVATKQVLSEVQAQVYSLGDSDELFSKEIEATVELNLILNQEQLIFAQKNRATWLKDGDRNTSFFQRLHRIKKARPGIHAMMVDRQISTDPVAIRLHIEQFYSQLFSADAGTIDFGLVPNLITPSVTAATCCDLTCIPGIDEVKAVVFGLTGDSAPGPDSFGGIFFHRMWDVIAGDVVGAVQYFFRFGRRNARCLKRILDSYASLSGQLFNPDKSKAYFGKHVSAQNKAYFRATLNIGSAALPFIYLGVPIFRGAPKAAHLRGTADRIIAKFAGWKGSSLSLVGRACLVNSVIVSSLVHSMMIYTWPRSLLNKIDKAMRNFIWTGSTEKKGFYTVN